MMRLHWMKALCDRERMILEARAKVIGFEDSKICCLTVWIKSLAPLCLPTVWQDSVLLRF